jgi:hypothetical protein
MNLNSFAFYIFLKIQISKFNLISHRKNAEFKLKLRNDFSTLIANLNIKRSTCDKKRTKFLIPFFMVIVMEDPLELLIIEMYTFFAIYRSGDNFFIVLKG